MTGSGWIPANSRSTLAGRLDTSLPESSETIGDVGSVMARLVGGDFAEERPETQMSQEFKDWYEPIARARMIENKQRDPADPLYPRYMGESLGFGHGILFPEPNSSLRIRITKLPGNELPAFLGIGTVSEKIKAKVEEIEPNVHQFLPLEVEMPDGSFTQERYWIWCNMNMLDALVLDKSKGMQPYYFNREKWRNYLEYEEVSGSRPIWALDKSVIAGKAKWVDYKLGRDFFSDHFAKWLDEQGINGWEAGDFAAQRTTIIEV